MVRAMWVGLVLSVVVDLAAGRTDGLDAESATACPSESEVEEELSRLGANSTTRPDISVDGNRMRVALYGRDGAPLGSREVEAPITCRERATVAAVLVASWMGLWPVDPKLGARPASQAPQDRLPGTAIAPAKYATPQSTQLGLTALATYDGNAPALGAMVEVRRSLMGPLRGWLALSCSTERELRVGAAQGGYLVPALEMGPAIVLGRGRLRGEVEASARLGVIIVRGKAMPTTYVKARAVPGMAANLRLVIAGERWSPFAIAGLRAWVGRHTMTLDNDAATADVPGWEGQIGLGVLWAAGL
jgi:hypothetical protein